MNTRLLERIIERLLAGESVALLSDAGTPGILIPVSGCGRTCRRFVRWCRCRARAPDHGFVGFRLLEHIFSLRLLPSKGSQRRQALSELIDLPYALAFTRHHTVFSKQSPILPLFLVTAPLVIARELTKMFESINLSRFNEALEWLKEDNNRQRGVSFCSFLARQWR